MAIPAMFVINPRRRRRRKMSAKQRKYFGKRRTRARSANPRRRRRRNPVGAYMTALAGNPRRRRHHVARRRIGRRRSRNPRFSVGGVMRQVIPAAIGGAGALGLDMALAVLPVPDMLKSGPLAILTKIAGAIGLGYVAGMVIGRERGRLVTTGALTVVAYNAIKQVAQQVAPTLPGLADYEDYQIGAYMASNMGRLGYVSPAPVLRGLRGYEPAASSDSDATIGSLGWADPDGM